MHPGSVAPRPGEEQTGRGEYQAAIAYARRYLAADELAEDMHRRLIALFAATGDRGAALRQFDQCAAVLERELGVRPLPETQAVHQAVLHDRPPPGVSRAARPAWRIRPGLEAPLFGREGPLQCLDQAFRRARAGQGGVVLISGEPGIGKSRLMQEFAASLEGRAWVLAGAGYPAGGQNTPYQLVVEVLRPAFSLGPVELDVLPAWLTEASRLLPELHSLYPHLPAPLPAEPEGDRQRLFEALCQLSLGLAAGAGPLVLCLDDLHYADSTSLDWLAYLGQRLRGSRLLVVGAYASQEGATLGPLRDGLARAGVLSELNLDGLDVPAARSLLRHLAGPLAGDQALAERLWSVTDGNPFFLLEIMRALMEGGRLGDGLTWSTQGGDGEELPLPDSVRAAVEARLRQLSPIARQVLEAGSVLGLAFGFDLVRLTGGRRELETLDGLEELVARQLLVEQAPAYRFHHEIIQAAVYRDLSYWRRRLLHRRAGRAHQRLRPEDAAALTWHFQKAEEPGLAARYALQAGMAARAVFAHAEALACFDLALSCLDREMARLHKPEDIAESRRQRIQALEGRGWAQRLLGDMEAYAHDSQEVARLADLLGDQRALAHLRWREAHAQRWFCHYTQALDAAR